MTPVSYACGGMETCVPEITGRYTIPQKDLVMLLLRTRINAFPPLPNNQLGSWAASHRKIQMGGESTSCARAFHYDDAESRASVVVGCLPRKLLATVGEQLVQKTPADRPTTRTRRF